MWCVMAAIFDMMLYMCCMVSMDCCIASACLSMSSMRCFMYCWFSTCVVFCMLIWNGIDVCSIGVPRPGYRLHPGDARDVEDALAILSNTSMSAGLRMS